MFRITGPVTGSITVVSAAAVFADAQGCIVTKHSETCQV